MPFECGVNVVNWLLNVDHSELMKLSKQLMYLD